ncbi:hypothetical protein ACFQ10_00610 [Streptomyces indonesiensis]
MTRRLLLSYLAPALLVLMGLEIPLGCCYAMGRNPPSPRERNTTRRC